MSENNFVLERLKEKFKSLDIAYSNSLGDDTFIVPRENIKSVVQYLKEEPSLNFNMLLDLTCVDYLGEEPRFEMVYHLFSIDNNMRIRIKCRVPENDPRVDSLTEFYKIADWFEREVWDMYGITFDGHPDLRRILLYEEFKGHPLRKDYPRLLEQPRIPLRDQEK